MRILRILFGSRGFGEIDRSITSLKELRDSYRALNVEIYGKEIAGLLNDW